MNIADISELKEKNADAQIFEIFPERWEKRREFSLYKRKGRPCSALFFAQGDVEICFYSGDKTVSAKKGDVVYIPEGICYTASIEKKNSSQTVTYTVNFDLFEESRKKLFLSSDIKILASRQDSLFERRFKELSDTVHRLRDTGDKESYNRTRAKGEFLLLLDSVADTASIRDDSYYPIRRGVDAFCGEWNKNERIEKYASLCGISETYFFRCFKKWSGVSPVEYRNNLRLSNAESLLRCTDMQIQEISAAVGFTDPFYFCRIFSDKYGMSPKKYRERYQGEG
ncbi:MAG: helix-turn-helix transcriptional regulator [Clostridia bacterium]|nr:helix-turn-helix transcriptional regulator [Clostridia bacterium]